MAQEVETFSVTADALFGAVRDLAERVAKLENRVVEREAGDQDAISGRNHASLWYSHNHKPPRVPARRIRPPQQQPKPVAYSMCLTHAELEHQRSRTTAVSDIEDLVAVQHRGPGHPRVTKHKVHNKTVQTRAITRVDAQIKAEHQVLPDEQGFTAVDDVVYERAPLRKTFATSRLSLVPTSLSLGDTPTQPPRCTWSADTAAEDMADSSFIAKHDRNGEYIKTVFEPESANVPNPTPLIGAYSLKTLKLASSFTSSTGFFRILVFPGNITAVAVVYEFDPNLSTWTWLQSFSLQDLTQMYDYAHVNSASFDFYASLQAVIGAVSGAMQAIRWPATPAEFTGPTGVWPVCGSIINENCSPLDTQQNVAGADGIRCLHIPHLAMHPVRLSDAAVVLSGVSPTLNAVDNKSNSLTYRFSFPTGSLTFAATAYTANQPSLNIYGPPTYNSNVSTAVTLANLKVDGMTAISIRGSGVFTIDGAGVTGKIIQVVLFAEIYDVSLDLIDTITLGCSACNGTAVTSATYNMPLSFCCDFPTPTYQANKAVMWGWTSPGYHAPVGSIAIKAVLFNVTSVASAAVSSFSVEVDSVGADQASQQLFPMYVIDGTGFEAGSNIIASGVQNLTMIPNSDALRDIKTSEDQNPDAARAFRMFMGYRSKSGLKSVYGRADYKADLPRLKSLADAASGVPGAAAKARAFGFGDFLGKLNSGLNTAAGVGNMVGMMSGMPPVLPMGHMPMGQSRAASKAASQAQSASQSQAKSAAKAAAAAQAASQAAAASAAKAASQAVAAAAKALSNARSNASVLPTARPNSKSKAKALAMAKPVRYGAYCEVPKKPVLKVSTTSSVPCALPGVLFPTAFTTGQVGGDLGAIPYLMVRGAYPELLHYSSVGTTMDGYKVYGAQPDESNKLLFCPTGCDMTALPIAIVKGKVLLVQGQPTYGRSCELAMTLCAKLKPQHVPAGMFTGCVDGSLVTPVSGHNMKTQLTRHGVPLFGAFRDAQTVGGGTDFFHVDTVEQAATALRSLPVFKWDKKDRAKFEYLIAGLPNNRSLLREYIGTVGRVVKPHHARTTLPSTHWLQQRDKSAAPADSPVTTVSGSQAILDA